MVQRFARPSVSFIRSHSPFFRHVGRAMKQLSSEVTSHPEKVAALEAGWNNALALSQDAFSRGLERPVSLAALYNAFPKEVRGVLLKEAATKIAENPEDESDIYKAEKVIKLHEMMSSNPTGEENFDQVKHPSDENILSSQLKVLDFIHNMPKYVKLRGPEIVSSVIRRAYLPFTALYRFHGLRRDLENVYVKYFHPTDHAKLKAMLDYAEKKHKPAQDNVAAILRRVAQEYSRENGVKIDVIPRPPKSPFALLGKRELKTPGMIAQDLAGVRVVFHEKDGEDQDATIGHLLTFFGVFKRKCEKELGRFDYDEDRTKIWLYEPKPGSDYRAMHILYNHEAPVEIQFRTGEANDVAEFGEASHDDVYKGSILKGIDSQTLYLRYLKRKGLLSNNALRAYIGKNRVAVFAKALNKPSMPEQLFVVPKGSSTANLFFLHGLHRENDEEHAWYPVQAFVGDAGKPKTTKNRLFEPLKNFDHIVVYPKKTVLERDARFSEYDKVSERKLRVLSPGKISAFEELIKSKMRRTRDAFEKKMLNELLINFDSYRQKLNYPIKNHSRK